jgi:hypothetical protein
MRHRVPQHSIFGKEDLALVRNPQRWWHHTPRMEVCLPPHMWGIVGISAFALSYKP